MDANDFSVGGMLASSVGLVVTDRPKYTRPMRRSTEYVVPGRSGALCRYERNEHDEPVYEQVTYAIGCALRRGCSMDAAMAMLCGGGQLEMGWIADSVFDARVNGVPRRGYLK